VDQISSRWPSDVQNDRPRPEAARPCLRVVAAFLDLGPQIADVGFLRIETEEHVDATGQVSA
jgi:hypothetical protein